MEPRIFLLPSRNQVSAGRFVPWQANPILAGIMPSRAAPQGGFSWSPSSNQSRRVLQRRAGAFDEILQVIGHRHAVAVAAHLDFPGDIRRQILRPVLQRVEGKDADRIFELSGQEVGNDRFEIAPFDLALDAPGRAGILDDDKNGLVSAIRYARRCEAGHGMVLRRVLPDQLTAPGFRSYAEEPTFG